MTVDPVLRVQSRLTDRDHVLLGWLADHGVLTSFQIAHALYPSLDVAQGRLRTLTQMGVLGRFRPLKPDGGSHPYHYVLDQLGVDVVAGQRGQEVPRRNAAKIRRWHLTNRANLPHLLTVNQFFTDLAGYARTHPGATLQRWWPAARCQGIGAFAEPDDEITVLAYTATIRPDGHGIWTADGVQVPFFAEVDLGTEPLWKLVDKLSGYGNLAQVTGRRWPVLFWLHSAVRERHLHQELAHVRLRVPVATAVRDDTTAGLSSAQAVWWLHGHTGAPLTLAGLAASVTDVLPRPHRAPVLPHQRGHHVNVIVVVAHRHPPHRVAVPVRRQPGGRNHLARDVRPLRIGQVPVGGMLRIEQCHTVLAGGRNPARTGCSNSSVNARTSCHPPGSTGGCSVARGPAPSHAATTRGRTCSSRLPGPNKYRSNPPTRVPRGCTAGIMAGGSRQPAVDLRRHRVQLADRVDHAGHRVLQPHRRLTGAVEPRSGGRPGDACG